MNCNGNNIFQGNCSCWLILILLAILLFGNNGCGTCGCESIPSSGCGCGNRCCD